MRSKRRALLCGVVVFSVLIGGSLGKYREHTRKGSLDSLPQISGCVREAFQSVDWLTVFVGPDAMWFQRFQCGATTLEVRLAVWYEQSPGKEAISQQNQVVPNNWQFEGKVTTVEFSDGAKIKEIDLLRDEQHLVVWSWFAVGDSAETTEFGAKFLEAIDAALFRASPTAIFVLTAQSADQDGARALLRSYHDLLWVWYVTNLESA